MITSPTPIKPVTEDVTKLAAAHAAGRYLDRDAEAVPCGMPTLGIAGFHASANLSLGQHHFVISAGIGDDALVIDIGGVGAHFIEKMAVMRNHQQAASVGQQVLLQPVD